MHYNLNTPYPCLQYVFHLQPQKSEIERATENTEKKK